MRTLLLLTVAVLACGTSAIAGDVAPDGGPAKPLTARTIDAFGANRQRLGTIAKATQGTRLLPDDFFNVPQNIVAPKDRPAALAAVNALIDEVRASGFLQRAIERGGAMGSCSRRPA